MCRFGSSWQKNCPEGKSLPGFSRTLHTSIHGDYTHWHSHQQWIKVPVSLYPCHVWIKFKRKGSHHWDGQFQRTHWTTESSGVVERWLRRTQVTARAVSWGMCGDGPLSRSLWKGQLSSQRSECETLVCMHRHQGSGRGYEITWPVIPTRANSSCLCQHTQRIKLIIVGKIGAAEEPARTSLVANKTQMLPCLALKALLASLMGPYFIPESLCRNLNSDRKSSLVCAGDCAWLTNHDMELAIKNVMC